MITSLLFMTALLAIGVGTGWYQTTVFPLGFGLIGAVGVVIGARVVPCLIR